MPEVAWVNGAISLLADAHVSVNNAGIRQGYGVFETLRGYGGRLFRLDDHLERMRAGAVFLGIEADTALIKTAVALTLEASDLPDARVRATLTAERHDHTTLIVTVEDYQPPTEATYRRGLNAAIVSIRRSTTSLLYRYKTLNQIENSLAATEAKRRGAVEAVMLNENGEVAETNRGNIFIIKDGVLRTPDIDAGILPGITRMTVLEAARNLGVQIFEGCITPEALTNADEAFITSSMVEVMPLARINDKTINNGTAGATTAELRRGYRSIVMSSLT